MVFVPALTENFFLAARNNIDYTLPKFIEVMFAIKPVFPLLLSVDKYGIIEEVHSPFTFDGKFNVQFVKVDFYSNIRVAICFTEPSIYKFVSSPLLQSIILSRKTE